MSRLPYPIDSAQRRPARAGRDPDVLLQSLGVPDYAHSGRTLRDHLKGTFALLRSWGCDEVTCVAGLLHSIYGTNAFRRSCLDTSERPRLRQLVGCDIEKVVYLFCASERPKAFLQAIVDLQITDRFDGSKHEVSRDVLQKLMAIECANLIEQSDQSGFLALLTGLPDDAFEAILGNDAAAGIRSFFSPNGRLDYA